LRLKVGLPGVVWIPIKMIDRALRALDESPGHLSPNKPGTTGNQYAHEPLLPGPVIMPGVTPGGRIILAVIRKVFFFQITFAP
ncbi:MAG: hypothetical protein QME78_17620, partial [Thermodesulfobacteriota bacterium]|nr:hypothetical protein [Thermodesulfobacteriota bacterium]